jgi:hypothetical protein
MKIRFQAFLRILKVEIYKLKGTFAFWLTLAYPFGTTFLVTLFWISMRNNKVINTDQFINNLGNVASFFLPFFIVLLISIACNTEHKSSMMKHLLSLPVQRTVLYFGKFAGIMMFILAALTLTYVFAYCSIFITGLVVPRLGFGTAFNHSLLIRILLRSYISAAAIYSIQYWLGMRLRNLTLPVAIGSALIILPIAVLMILGITGLITKMDSFSKIISYNPYSYPYSAAFNFTKTTEVYLFPTITLVFMLISVVALILGSVEFNRRNV